MLACPCRMIKPLRFATSKRPSSLRYYSVLKMPLDCSCYTKGYILLHVVRNKQFNRLEWNIQSSILNNQKNFIWTSLLFWKNSEGKFTSSPEDPSKSRSEKIQNTPLRTENAFSNTLDKPKDPKNLEEKIDEGVLNVSKKQDLLNNNVSNDFGKIVESNEKVQPNDAQKLNRYIMESIVLSDNRTKTPGAFTSLGEISGLDNKVLVKPVKKEAAKVPEGSDALKSDTKSSGDIKRQTYELNLGKFNKTEELKEPPNIISTETGREADEIDLVKENPQKFFEKAKTILLKSTLVKSEDNGRITKTVDLGEAKGNIDVTKTARRRQTVDLNRSSMERNFITPVRAMTDFLLKPSDLEGLRKTKRRSPYENDPPITVYWRKDVEAKALDVWGSKENLLKEILKRDIERRRYQQNLFTVKRRLRDYRREQGRESEIKLEQNGLFGSSGKVVLTAIAINGANFMFKLIAWLYTGSHSMFSEAVHSLADTINQLILAYGIHKSVQRADSDHPYGYTNMRYVASLISGVGIFCVGSGLSIYHGVVGLTSPSDLPSFYWAYFILAGSLASEGATLLVAFNSIRIGARKSDMSLSEYVLRGQDPSVNVVLLEDAAAVIGVIFAGSCMGLSSYYNSHIPDAIGSFLVGGLLAGVASFIIYTNVAALVGRSIPQERLDKINAELESDVMIRAIHDVKGIDIGNSLVRYKAEMDFDGGELTRSYLDKQDLNQMLEEVRKMQTIDELEEFMLRHGENIVDMMGGEIDRIELKLRKKHPEIRHCDLEIL